MVDIYTRIRAYAVVPSLSKHEQIVNGVLTSIEDNLVERGQMLPSINQMSNNLGFARKTINRAYSELKDRGLVESRNRKGFFVSTEAVGQIMRVALVLYEFRPFQEMFYNVFRQSVGGNVQVDTFFHHDNISVFEDIVTKITGHYGVYVVAPVLDHRTPKILDQIISNRLLLIDRHVTMEKKVSCIIQEFEKSTYKVLTQLQDRIQQYKWVELFFRDGMAYPLEILAACQRFCREQEVTLKIKEQFLPGTIETNVLYLTIGDADLWTMLEDCIDQGFVLGRDVGILSHNESRIKKMIHGGVSTWSTDFSRMAELAADFVLNRQPEQIIIPTVFIDRNSC